MATEVVANEVSKADFGFSSCLTVRNSVHGCSSIPLPAVAYRSMVTFNPFQMIELKALRCRPFACGVRDACGILKESRWQKAATVFTQFGPGTQSSGVFQMASGTVSR